jgi:chaperonin GroEL
MGKLAEEEQVGVRIVRRARKSPRVGASNAGWESAVVLDKIRTGKGGFGFNAAKEEFSDLFKDGIVDPTKVVRTALQNAASIAGLLLTSEAAIAEKPAKGPAASPQMPDYDM